jgi:hypothetical protein
MESLLVKFPRVIVRPVPEADAKGTPRHYRRTAILNELLDNKFALFTQPNHDVN